MMGNRHIMGKCSLCGGVVSVPTVWMGVQPPVPTCESCGAIEDSAKNLPVVPMRPAPQWNMHASSVAKSHEHWYPRRESETHRGDDGVNLFPLGLALGMTITS